MPQYLLSVWHDEDYVVDFSSPEAQARVAQVAAFNDELQRSGAWVFAGGLHPASSATVVRPAGDHVSMTDGPYAETKEQMGGVWIIQAADLDAALGLARKAPRPATVRSKSVRCRHDRHARRGIPSRGRPLHRHADPRPRRHRPRGGRGGGGVRDRRRAMAAAGDPAEPRRLDHHHCTQPRDRPAAPRIHPC